MLGGGAQHQTGVISEKTEADVYPQDSVFVAFVFSVLSLSCSHGPMSCCVQVHEKGQISLPAGAVRGGAVLDSNGRQRAGKGHGTVALSASDAQRLAERGSAKG